MNIDDAYVGQICRSSGNPSFLYKIVKVGEKKVDVVVYDTPIRSVFENINPLLLTPLTEEQIKEWNPE